MHEEGWYQDPYRTHEDRWYSDGNPTKLVRDEGVECFDPPPLDAVPSQPLVRSTYGKERSGPAYVEPAPPNYAETGVAAATKYGSAIMGGGGPF